MPHNANPGAKNTVLFIDDEPSDMGRYYAAARKFAWKVSIAVTPKEGLEQAKRLKDCLAAIVLDLGIPNRDQYPTVKLKPGILVGELLYRDLRKAYPTVPIIVLTNFVGTKVAPLLKTRTKLHRYYTKGACLPNELMEAIRCMVCGTGCEDPYMGLPASGSGSGPSNLLQIRRPAFIIMPMINEFALEDVADVFVQSLKRNGYAPTHPRDLDSGKITERTLLQISNADVILADLSFARPNVYYEIGYAHGLKKENVFLFCRSGERVHTDLLPYHVTEYNNIGTQLRYQLDKKLREIAKSS